MTTLAEFLLARVAEDEAQARALEPASERYPYGDRELPPTPFDKLGDELVGYLGGPLGDHAARWAPARVLAECAAKRHIVDGYLAESRGREEFPARTPVAGALFWAMKALALPYAEHPDYREEWKP